MACRPDASIQMICLLSQSGILMEAVRVTLCPWRMLSASPVLRAMLAQVQEFGASRLLSKAVLLLSCPSTAHWDGCSLPHAPHRAAAPVWMWSSSISHCSSGMKVVSNLGKYTDTGQQWAAGESTGQAVHAISCFHEATEVLWHSYGLWRAFSRSTALPQRGNAALSGGIFWWCET